MIKILKKVWHYFIIFIVSGIFSFILFYLFLHPISISSLIKTELSLAGMSSNSVSIPLNPVNRLVAQLNQKEKELIQREKDLALIEERIIKRNSFENNSFLLFVLIILVLLSVLILLNFYFDHKRLKRRMREKLVNNVEEGRKILLK